MSTIETTDDQKTKTTTDANTEERVAPSKAQIDYLNGQLVAAKFGNIVTILMQSAAHQQITLKELHERVVPPFLYNQYRLAEAHKEGSGQTIPVGVIIWAAVADEIHTHLLDESKTDYSLKNEEWKSGDNYWIIDAVGPQRFLTPLLTGLREKEFSGKTVYYRASVKDGIEVRSFKEGDE